MLIIAATFLVYWPALRNGFVWDDTALVLRDPLIRSWTLIGESFRHFLFLDATASNFYRPIQRLSFIADYQLFGFDHPGGWHFTSILIHAGAAVALFFVAEKLFALAGAARRGWALGIALLWAIHPLHTSAVTYIAGRADPLAALFGFTGLALGLASLEANRRVWRWRLGAAASLALALLSKESGVTFLIIWILVLLWQRIAWRTLGVWAVVLAALVGGYCGLRFTAAKTPPPPPTPTALAIRPILAARALAEYASLVVAPVTLRMERDVSTRPRDTFQATMQNARLREFQTLGGVLLLVALAVWLRFATRRAPAAAFCLGGFAVAYVPISNVFSLNATVAEHWLYVPSAFLFLAAALTLTALGAQENRSALLRSAPLRWALTAVLAGWAVALGGRTFLRQADWRDQRTFIERNLAAGGDSARMLMNLANVELAAGKPERALELYREAVQRAPEQPIIALGLAQALARSGDFAGARGALGRAETAPMLRADVLQLRAVLDYREHGTDPGDLLRQAAEVAPANWPHRRRYVEHLIERGDRTTARTELLHFLEKYPFRAESWRLLGRLLEATREPARAKVAYAEAVHRDVRDDASRARLQALP